MMIPRSVFDTQKFLVRIFKVVKLRLVSFYLYVVQMAFAQGKAGNLILIKMVLSCNGSGENHEKDKKKSRLQTTANETLTH